MRRILHFPLSLQYTQDLRMPRGAKILSVVTFRETVHLFAECDDDAESPYPKRRINTRATADQLDGEEGVFLGTVPTPGGMFVMHVFDAGEVA